MNRKIYSTLLATLCLGILSFAAVTIASAQGRYANVYSKSQVSATINKLEQSSNTFRRDFDRQMDQSNLNGTREEDRLNGIVGNYAESLDRLRGDFDRNDNWWESRSNVQDVMNNARPVNVMMNSLGFARRLERQWNRMRQDLNKLADTYDLPDLSGGGWTGGPGGGGGGNGSAPSWAVGTFYGRIPQTGGTITLVVNRNGRVSADFQGSVLYGTMNGQNLNMGVANSRVIRINNGIRTVRNDNGETIDYYRGGGGGGPIGGNVPSWALGTFTSTSTRIGGGGITLSIRENGEVYVSFSGGSNAYGTIYGTTLTINGATSNVTRLRNGIRTTRTDNGERIDYYR